MGAVWGSFYFFGRGETLGAAADYDSRVIRCKNPGQWPMASQEGRELPFPFRPCPDVPKKYVHMEKRPLSWLHVSEAIYI